MKCSAKLGEIISSIRHSDPKGKESRDSSVAEFTAPMAELPQNDSPSFDFAQEGELAEPRGCPLKDSGRDNPCLYTWAKISKEKELLLGSPKQDHSILIFKSTSRIDRLYFSSSFCHLRV